MAESEAEFDELLEKFDRSLARELQLHRELNQAILERQKHTLQIIALLTEAGQEYHDEPVLSGTYFEMIAKLQAVQRRNPNLRLM